MQSSPQVTEIELSDDILAQIYALPDACGGARPAVWTAEQDEILRRYWTLKRHKDICKIIGYCEKTCRARYEKLMEESE